MRTVTVHVRNGKVDIATLPDGIEVDLINFDDSPSRYRYFVYDGEVIEQELDPPNIIEGGN